MKLTDIKPGVDYGQDRGRDTYNAKRRVRVVDVGPFVTTYDRYARGTDRVTQFIDGDQVTAYYKPRGAQGGPRARNSRLYVAARYVHDDGSLGEVEFYPITEIHCTWADLEVRKAKQVEDEKRRVQRKAEQKAKFAADVDTIRGLAADCDLSVEEYGGGDITVETYERKIEITPEALIRLLQGYTRPEED